ncbi:hypothetical protein [Streptomyces sp. NPDC059593]|uniref:hypothetical protein n=1 Tax=Streptomyces sp. NPDC059593 TaxID=3346878 RepID=UPI00368EB899
MVLPILVAGERSGSLLLADGQVAQPRTDGRIPIPRIAVAVHAFEGDRHVVGRSGPHADEEIRQALEGWMSGDRFGEVMCYDGGSLNAPEIPAAQLKGPRSGALHLLASRQMCCVGAQRFLRLLVVQQMHPC